MSTLYSSEFEFEFILAVFLLVPPCIRRVDETNVKAKTCKRPNVTGCGLVLILYDLGRLVAWGANTHCMRRRCCFFYIVLGQAKVRQFEMTIMCYQHIFRFDVAVNNESSVSVLQRRTDLPEDLEDLQLRYYFATSELLNVTIQVSLAEFLLDPDVRFSFEPAEATRDVWMFQFLHLFCLSNEFFFLLFFIPFFDFAEVLSFKSDILSS